MNLMTNANIAQTLADAARAHPDHLAVVIQRGAGQRLHYTEHSADALHAASCRMAQGLTAMGIGKGVRTVLMVKPSFEFFALTFALFKTGAVPVMIDPGIGLPSLKTCIAEAEPEAFIGIPKAHVARILFGWGKQTLRTLITVGRFAPWGGTTLRAITAKEGGDFDAVPLAPGDQAAILFTSGSTGIPKGAVYTHGIFQAQIDALRNDYGVTPGERDLATFPLFALFGPALGMAAVIPEMDATRPAQADPRKIVAAIREYEATNMFASPALIDVVGRFGSTHGTLLPSLKRVVSSGAPADPESLERFARMLTAGAAILPSYGATEALPVAFIRHQEQIADTAEATRNGAGVCVGRPVRAVTVDIMKVTDAAVPEFSAAWRAAPGVPGEIVVSGPMVTASYFNRDASTALAKMRDAEGRLWHRMGDIGYFDGQGRLWMCGRKSHRVELPEGALYSVSCERVFNVHPKVRRTALVGAIVRGERVAVLCVEMRPDVTVDQDTLRSELLAMGQANPVTRAIRTILFHPSFPVDIRHNAKIFREKLAEWATEQLA